MPVRLEPGAPRSKVKHSTILRSHIFISDFATKGFNFATRKNNLDNPVFGIVHVNKLKFAYLFILISP